MGVLPLTLPLTTENPRRDPAIMRAIGGISGRPNPNCPKENQAVSSAWATPLRMVLDAQNGLDAAMFFPPKFLNTDNIHCCFLT